jgi:tetratricopeptide (TPR) repeat protein
MTLFRQGKPAEARNLSRLAEVQMAPFPQDEHQPLVDGRSVDHDVLILWLAYKEAKALIEGPSAPVAVPLAAKEAIALFEQACELDPKDTYASLRLATWQTWVGHDPDYEATRRRLLQQAEATDLASTASRAAKAACLRPSTDATLLAKALNLAQRAVELGEGNPNLPWYQLSLGLAEYRNGQYAAAEGALAVADQTAGGDGKHEIQGTARLFRAMSLFRQGKPEGARKLFNQAEAQLPPLPKDESKPLVDGKPVSHDVLICWLAYKEAKALIEGPSAPVAEPSAPK